MVGPGPAVLRDARLRSDDGLRLTARRPLRRGAGGAALVSRPEARETWRNPRGAFHRDIPSRFSFDSFPFRKPPVFVLKPTFRKPMPPSKLISRRAAIPDTASPHGTVARYLLPTYEAM